MARRVAKSIEENPMYEELNNATRNIAKRLDTELERPATLQDFISSMIVKYSYNDVDQKYNGLVQAWALTGRDVSNSEDIYTSIFGDLNLMESAEFESTNYEVAQEVEKISNLNKESKKDFSDYLPWIWGAGAIFFILIGTITKYPYALAIILAIIIINFLIKKNNE